MTGNENSSCLLITHKIGSTLKFNFNSARKPRSASARAVLGLRFQNRARTLIAGGATVALVATGAITVPQVLGTTASAVAQEANWQIETQQAADAAVAQQAVNNDPIDADAIASGVITSADDLLSYGLISGHVYATHPDGYPNPDTRGMNVEQNGVTVYAQFFDGGSYSPIYRAQSHPLPGGTWTHEGNGMFVFGMPGQGQDEDGNGGIKWTDSKGDVREFTAESGQKYRIWTEPFETAHGTTMYPIRQAGGYLPGAFVEVGAKEIGSVWGSDHLRQTAVFIQEHAPNHETSYMAASGANLKEDSAGFADIREYSSEYSDTISGRVWHERGGAFVDHDNRIPPKYDVTPSAADRQDYPAREYTVYASTLTADGAASNQALLERYAGDPDELARQTRLMLEANPQYIRQTVRGTTDSEGRYTLRFDEGALNENHVFLWVENSEGVVQSGYTGFQRPIFQVFDRGQYYFPQREPEYIEPRQDRNLKWVNYAIVGQSSHAGSVNITNFDNDINGRPAYPGATAIPAFGGSLTELPTVVEWRDAAGVVHKTCELSPAQSYEDQVAACTFDIPADAEVGDEFSVVLVVDGEEISADSLMVMTFGEALGVDYAETDAVVGTPAILEPAFEFTLDESAADMPEGTSFELGQLPEGVDEVDALEDLVEDEDERNNGQVYIDAATGTITYIPGLLQADSAVVFPVIATYRDNSTGEADATYNVAPVIDFEPIAPESSRVRAGETVESVPIEFIGADEDASLRPIDPLFELAPEFEIPVGYSVEVNPQTGVATVVAPDQVNDDTARGFNVPVIVSYPHNPGSADDTVDVPFELETDAALIDPDFADVSGRPTEEHPVDYTGGPIAAGSEITLNPNGDQPEFTFTVDEDGNVKVLIPEGAAAEDYPVEVTITYPDGSTDTDAFNINVFILDFVPEELDASRVRPGDTVESAPITFASDEKPDNPAFAIDADFEVPEGYSVEINPETGVVTVVALEQVDGETVKSFTVPVIVSYPHDPGSVSDTVDALFQLIPYAELIDPEFEPVEGKPGEVKPVENTGDAVPAGSEIAQNPNEDQPAFEFTVDGEGDVEVRIPEDAAEGAYPVEVTITYPDGSTGTEIIDITVGIDLVIVDFQPVAPAVTLVEPTEPAVSPAITFEGEEPEAPVFAIEEGYETPEGYSVEINAETGEVTVNAPDFLDKDTIEEFDVPVIVSYPNHEGSEDDKVLVPFQLDTDGDGNPDVTDEDDDGDGYTDEEEIEAGTNPKDPDSKPTEPTPPISEQIDPDLQDVAGLPGDVRPVANIGDPIPAGSEIVPTDSVPGFEFEVDENGDVTVAIPETAVPGEYEVEVTITYPDGSTDIDELTITVQEPESEASLFDPSYDEVQVEYGATEVSDIIWADNQQPDNATFSITDALEAIDGWTINGVDTNGAVSATAPSIDELGAIVKELKAEGLTSRQVAAAMVAYFGQDAPVEVSYSDGSIDSALAAFVLLDRDGRPLTEDDDDDWDNDGVLDEDEIEAGTNPFDPDDMPEEVVDAPDWNDDTVSPGDSVNLPNVGGEVTPGTSVNTDGPGAAVLNPDGSITVTADDDAEDGDIITITVEDAEGNVVDTIDVTVEEEPDAGEPIDDGASSVIAGSTAGGSSGLIHERCVPLLLGAGIPLLAILPLGLAVSVGMPGVDSFLRQAGVHPDNLNARVRELNTGLQNQLGVLNPQLSAQVEAALRQLGPDASRLAGGAALSAVSLLVLGTVAAACAPDSESSSDGSSAGISAEGTAQGTGEGINVGSSRE